jgi:hypothetical protein
MARQAVWPVTRGGSAAEACRVGAAPCSTGRRHPRAPRPPRRVRRCSTRTRGRRWSRPARSARRHQRAGAARAHRFEQQCMQVGAVHAEVRGAVALLHGIAERQAGQHGAAAGAADHQRIGTRRDGREARAQVELLKTPRDVGAELHAGTDFAEDGRLLEDVGAVPAPESASAVASPPMPPPATRMCAGIGLSGCSWTTARCRLGWPCRPCRLGA